MRGARSRRPTTKRFATAAPGRLGHDGACPSRKAAMNGFWKCLAAVAAASSTAVAATDPQPTRYGFSTCDGARLFHREAGERSRPTLLLLHGNPSSSQMFRDLIPLLADDFHLV